MNYNTDCTDKVAQPASYPSRVYWRKQQNTSRQ